MDADQETQTKVTGYLPSAEIQVLRECLPHLQATEELASSEIGVQATAASEATELASSILQLRDFLAGEAAFSKDAFDTAARWHKKYFDVVQSTLKDLSSSWKKADAASIDAVVAWNESAKTATIPPGGGTALSVDVGLAMDVMRYVDRHTSQVSKDEDEESDATLRAKLCEEYREPLNVIRSCNLLWDSLERAITHVRDLLVAVNNRDE